MSEAIELFKKLPDGGYTATGVFYCSVCRAVFPNHEQAAICHGDRLCACGKKIERPFYSLCNDCEWEKQKKDASARERERFEKATKITEADYKGEMVFLDDKYFDEVESAIDGYLPGQEPEYVWACKNQGVPLANAESIYENLLEHMWEEAEVSDLNGVGELEAAVKAFNEANRSIQVFVPDYSTAILVEKRPVAAEKA